MIARFVGKATMYFNHNIFGGGGAGLLIAQSVWSHGPLCLTLYLFCRSNSMN